jgi:hypothetical protein
MEFYPIRMPAPKFATESSSRNLPRKKRAAVGKILALAFLIRQAQHLLMTPATRRAKPTDGALRAAKVIERNPSFIESTAEVIDRETGVRELVEILENIIAEAGDLIESRSPELVAHARATLRHFSDKAPRHAE